MSKARLLSGKVKKRSGSALDPYRRSYLGLADAEADLGTPNFDGAMLISNADGQRFWTDNIRIDLTGNIAVGTISNSDGSSAIRMVDNVLMEDNLIVDGFTTAPDLFTSRISSTDSSAITFTPAVIMQSDLTVENELFVNGRVTAPQFVGDLIGNVIGDLIGNISGNITGDITGSIIGDITTSTITSSDSAAITMVPPVVMNSDLTVENDLRVTNGVYADNFFGEFFGPITGDVFTSTISSADSSAITVNNELILRSDLTVENTLFSDNITSNNITVDGDAVITGNLTVQGTTTTINSTTLVVEDKNIELAKGSTTALAADGAGITVLGPATPASLTYSASDDTWNFNKTLKSNVIGDVNGDVTGNLTGDVTGNLTGDVTGRIFTTEIDSPDSSAISVTPAVIMQSDLTVENELVVNGRIVAPLFVGDIQGNVIGNISGNITGDIIGSIIGDISTSTITSPDSSEITIVPAVRMNSDLTVENDLRVTNGVYAENFFGYFNGRISDISDHSIGELSDVDIYTDPPQNNQGLVWNSSLGKFVPGVTSDQDLTTSSDVTFASVTTNTLLAPTITTPDSSTLTIIPAAVFNSDVSVENDLTVRNYVIAPTFIGDVVGRVSDISDHSIGELYDVELIDPQDQQTLLWDAATARFKLGNALDQDLTETSDVVFNSVTANIFTTLIDSPDSSAITFVPAVQTLSDFSVDGDMLVTGNLTVQGSTTTINSTTLTVNDKNIELAKGANSAAAADGAGLTVLGPSTPATFTYSAINDSWNLNKDLYADLVGNVTGNLIGNVTGNISTNRIDSPDSSAISVTPAVVFNSDIIVENEIFGFLVGKVSDISNHSIGELYDVDISTTPPLNRQTIVWDSQINKFVPGDSFNSNDFNIAFAAKTTDDLQEGQTNLYFTDQRARDVIVPGTGVGYIGSTGEIYIGQDVSENANATFTSVTADIRTGNISSPDSTQITVENSTEFQSDVNVGNSLFVKNDAYVEGTIFATNLFIFDTTVGNFQGAITSPEAVALFRELITGGISSLDSSAIRFLNSVRIESDLTVDGDIFGNVVGQVSDISNHRLNDLGDVNIVDPEDKQALLYDAATNTFVLGSTIGQDVTTNADVVFNSITGNIFTNLIDSPDSSAITVTPAVVFSSDITVENQIFGNVVGQVSDISNHRLNDLGDVNIVDPEDKQALLYDAATNTFVLGSTIGQDVTTNADVVFNSITGAIFTTEIDSPDSSAITVTPAVIFSSDITVENQIFGNVVGQVSDISNHRLDDLSDVTIVNPQDKQALLYDAATNTFVLGSVVGQDVTIGADVIFNSVTANTMTTTTMFASTIDTIDSSEITIVPSLRTQSDLSVEGDLVIRGDLTVQGTTTTINSTTLVVEDKNIELAKGATTAAAADGAGLTILGPAIPATLLYTAATDSWNFNKEVRADVFGTVTGSVFTSLIDSTDSSAIRIVPALDLDSDLSVGNDLSVAGGVTVNETVTAQRFIGNVIGQVSDITNHSIGELYDVDITTNPPTSNQTLVWSVVNGKFVPGNGINQDVTTDSEVTFLAVTAQDILTPRIDTPDSSALTIIPAVVMKSDLTVENELLVNNSVTAQRFIGNVIGQVSDITNHSIGELSDVDIYTVKPQDKQVLIWSDADNKFIPGKVIDQDVSGGSDVTFASVTVNKLNTPLIDTVDSSEITFTPAVRMNSDLTVENDLRVNNSVTAESFIGYLDGAARDIADSAFTNKTLSADVETQDQVLFYDVSANEVRRSTIADAAIRGYTGSQGEDGQFGGASFYYQFDDQTVNVSMNPGELLIDNTDFSSATVLQLNNIDYNGSDISSFIQTVDDSTSDIKGYAKITDKEDYTNFVIFAITGVHTVDIGHFNIPVAYVSGTTVPFADGADVIVSFVVHGDKGDIGYTGSKGDSSFTFGATPPPNPEIGARWYDTVRGLLVVYVDDGDSLQWVEMGATGFLGRTGYTGSAGNLSADVNSSSAGKILVNDGVNPSWMAGSMMFRNRIINGGFDIWQRSTSQTSNGYGSADRWFCGNLISTKTVTREEFDFSQNTVEGEPNYYLRTVVQSVSNSSSSVNLVQRIESVKTLSGKTATMSFWARADSTKNIAVEFLQNFGSGGTPSGVVNGIGSQLVQISSDWQKYSVTVTLPSVIGKTLGTFGNDSLQMFIWFDAGSNSNQRTANLGQQSGTFDLAQIQLEEGPTATVFERRHISTEESLCYRYYWRWTATATFGTSPFTGNAISTTVVQSLFNMVVPMRATPTSVETGGTLRVTDGLGGGEDITNVAVLGSISAGSRYAVPINFTVASGITQYRPYFISASDDATAYIGIIAEI